MKTVTAIFFFLSTLGCFLIALFHVRTSTYTKFIKITSIDKETTVPNTSQSRTENRSLKDISLENFIQLTDLSNSEKEEVKTFYNLYMNRCHGRDRLFNITIDYPLCPCFPQTLGEGNSKMSITKNDTVKFNKLYNITNNSINMGLWKPGNCKPRWYVAIIIPYRNRAEHLYNLLTYMHPFLQSQLIAYRIYIIEQMLPNRFNRAYLLNIGYIEAVKSKENFNCVIFHDVDILPEDPRSMYTCEFAPVHLAAHMQKYKYRLPYYEYFGGVTVLTTDQFATINGFSNLFFGWGGEDDDLLHRCMILLQNATITRYPKALGKSFMIQHKRDTGNPPGKNRFAASALHSSKDYQSDGLSTASYSVEFKKYTTYLTWIQVNLEKQADHAPCIKAGLNCWSDKYLNAGLNNCCTRKNTVVCCIKSTPWVTGKKQTAKFQVLNKFL